MATDVDRFFAAAAYQQPAPIDVSIVPDRPASSLEAGTPQWWVDRLYRRMRSRNLALAELRAYYEGTNPTWQLADAAHRRTFGNTFRDLRMNLAKTVVEVVESRMSVIGMQLWDDDGASGRAWAIWQANRLDARSSDAHIHMLSHGECPVIVGPGDDPAIPLVTVEDPLQVIVEEHPNVPGRRMAALKVWKDADGTELAVLYLPGQVTWYRGTTRRGANGTGSWERLGWVPIDGKSQENALGVVPVVMLRNVRGRAEHASILSQLELIASALYRMVTASQYASYPQRTASGLTLANDEDETDEDGNVVAPAPAPVQTGPDTLVTSEDPETKFGAFPTTDLQAFVTEIREYRSQAGVINGIPQRLIVAPPTSVPSSGESVRLDDAPLTARIRRIETTVGNDWEDVIRLAFLTAGDRALAARMDWETRWADPELHGEAEHIDSLVKMRAMGVPDEELWRRMGASPQEIGRWRAQAAAQTPPPPTDGGGAAGGTDSDGR